MLVSFNKITQNEFRAEGAVKQDFEGNQLILYNYSVNGSVKLLLAKYFNVTRFLQLIVHVSQAAKH